MKTQTGTLKSELLMVRKPLWGSDFVTQIDEVPVEAVRWQAGHRFSGQFYDFANSWFPGLLKLSITTMSPR
jgi:hypothetical protein